MTAVRPAGGGRTVIVLAVTALVSACAVSPPRPPADDPQQVWDQRVRNMRSIDQWEIRGRLAVRTSRRGETVSMYWVRQGSDHEINLYGPMGAGRVILNLDENGAVLRDNKDKVHYDDSAEALLTRVAGWRVPFQDLQHWVLGTAAPDADYDKELDPWGRLTTLTQNGWRIEITEYHYYDGRDMPRRLVMNTLPGTEPILDDRSGENQTVQVKAVIRSWDWSQN